VKKKSKAVAWTAYVHTSLVKRINVLKRALQVTSAEALDLMVDELENSDLAESHDGTIVPRIGLPDIVWDDEGKRVKA
jgi:hypothetical protein